MTIVQNYIKLSLQDYPGFVSSICFLHGCQLRCGYCHNPDLVIEDNIINKRIEFMAYLKKRKNLLDGVVISGGEPLASVDLEHFIKDIKTIGLKIKLDTNGGYPDRLKKLIDQDLVDYVAMDYKVIESMDPKLLGLNNIEPYLHLWNRSLEILDESHLDFELRTTLIKNHHTLKILKEMETRLLERLRYRKPIWYFQKFVDNNNLLIRHSKYKFILKAYTEDQMINLKSRMIYPVQLR